MADEEDKQADIESTEEKETTAHAGHETHAESEKKEAPEPEKKPAKHADLLKKVREQSQHYAQLYWAKKRLAIPISVVALLLLLAVVPYSRYTLVGLLVKQDLMITVVDSRVNTPVSKANVMIGGLQGTTDATGKVRVRANVGYRALTISKQYYNTYSQTQLVSLSKNDNTVTIELVAVGRLVPVTVTNTLTGKPVAGATVKALYAEAVTGKDGVATIVLPVGLATQDMTIQGKGYNSLSGKLTVTDQKISANSFAIIPAGKLYFLSNLSGKIDVVKTDLDGSNRQTVVAGTGYENAYSTALLASRDWKYLALYAQRKPKGNPEIDLIDTSTDSMTNIDEGDASFSLVGWEGNRFIYRVDRNSIPSWQNGHQVIKSFDATTRKLTTLAQTTASGDQYNYAYQSFGGIYAFGGKVVYVLDWSVGYYYQTYLLNGKQATLNSINVDGSGKSVVKSFSMASGTQTSYIAITTTPYDKPNGIAILFSDGNNDTFYEYEDGKVTKVDDITQQSFYSSNYPTFLLSPSGNSTFWSVHADGKNNLKVGDSDAQNAKVIANETDYSPYGWFTDDYLLVQKSGSELYVLASDGSSQPFKITNYYKPNISYRGYGGGYGGL